MKNKPQDFCSFKILPKYSYKHIYLYQNYYNDGSQIMPCPAFMFVSKEGLVLDSSFSTFVSPLLRPFSFSSSAKARKVSKFSQKTFALPKQRKFRMDNISSVFRPLMKIRECGCLSLFNISMKRGLEASVSSLSDLSSPNIDVMFF